LDFGAVHGQVRFTQEILACASWTDRDPYAGADDDLATLQHNRGTQRVGNPFGNRDSVGFAGDVLQEYREFVAADPRAGICAAKAAQKSGWSANAWAGDCWAPFPEGSDEATVSKEESP
jgi:hypothetical protein